MNNDYRMQTQAPEQKQPLLPRISIESYFITVLVLGTIIALAIRLGSHEFRFLLLLMIGSVIIFLLATASTFLVAFMIGALRQLLFEPSIRTESPFASETMPPQVIPRQARD